MKPTGKNFGLGQSADEAPNERQVYSPMGCFVLNDRDRQEYAQDVGSRVAP